MLPKELEDLVEIPDALAECWGWFLRLNRKRPSGFGVSEIPYSEIKSFFQLIGVEPSLDELEIIEMFDRVAMEHYSKEAEKEKSKKPK